MGISKSQSASLNFRSRFGVTATEAESYGRLGNSRFSVPRCSAHASAEPRSRRGDVRARLSAERAVDGDLVESVLEDGELLIVELREEQIRDPAQVDGSSLGEARYA